MNWVQRKIYLYNVTFGLYMLDWWERYLFNILVIVLMWFIFYNSSRYVTEFCKSDAWEDWDYVRMLYGLAKLKFSVCTLFGLISTAIAMASILRLGVALA